jgi:hypothetical protein
VPPPRIRLIGERLTDETADVWIAAWQQHAAKDASSVARRLGGGLALDRGWAGVRRVQVARSGRSGAALSQSITMESLAIRW